MINSTLQEPGKELLVYVMPSQREVSILVPKQRGTGFLKVPFGHHRGPMSDIETEIGYDIYGLDGSLDVQIGLHPTSEIPALLDRIMPPICEHYGLPYRRVEASEFWGKHPIKTHPR